MAKIVCTRQELGGGVQNFLRCCTSGFQDGHWSQTARAKIVSAAARKSVDFETETFVGIGKKEYRVNISLVRFRNHSGSKTAVPAEPAGSQARVRKENQNPSGSPAAVQKEGHVSETLPMKLTLSTYEDENGDPCSSV